MAQPRPSFDPEDWADDDPEQTEELAFFVSLRRDRLAAGGTTPWRGTVQDRKSCQIKRVRGWNAVLTAMRAAEAALAASTEQPPQPDPNAG